MIRRLRFLALTSLCAFVLGWPARLQAESPNVRFDVGSQRLSVELDDQPLIDVLGRLATSTGWHIFVEPDSNPEITTTFTDLPTGRALQILLGTLNYALIRETDGPSRLYVFSTSRANATQRIEAAPQVLIRRVGNELIVMVKPGTNIEALAAGLGAKVVGQLGDKPIYRLRFENQEAADAAEAALTSNDSVTGVDHNYEVDRPRSPQSASGAPASPVQLALKPPPADGQVVIGLVDTAVQSLGTDLDAFLLPSQSVAGQADPSPLEPTHGTSMLDTIFRSLAASSPDGSSVRILPVDIYGPNASTTSFDVVNGIITAVNGGANVISISSGSYGNSPTLTAVVQEVLDLGIPIFGAGGNLPVPDPVYPAAIGGVYAVTAYENNAPAPYSTTGGFVDLYGPGIVPGNYQGTPYAIRGTSPATAWMSGQAAAYAAQEGIPTAQAAQSVAQRFAVP